MKREKLKRKVLLIDTSILTVWLEIPSFDITENTKLDKTSIDSFLQKKQEEGYTFMLPIATIIETGNHVAQIKDGNVRYEIVNKFADLLIKLANQEHPWLLNSNEVRLFTSDELTELAKQWKEKGVYKLSLGDASILKVANDLKTNFDVDVFTDDTYLESLVKMPPNPVYVPRRRK